jgi:hypothetical protein
MESIMTFKMIPDEAVASFRRYMQTPRSARSGSDFFQFMREEQNSGAFDQKPPPYRAPPRPAHDGHPTMCPVSNRMGSFDLTLVGGKFGHDQDPVGGREMVRDQSDGISGRAPPWGRFDLPSRQNEETPTPEVQDEVSKFSNFLAERGLGRDDIQRAVDIALGAQPMAGDKAFAARFPEAMRLAPSWR